jgi:hypothetical protein
MATLIQIQTIARLLEDGWTNVEVWGRADPGDLPIGGPAIMTNGYGGLAQIESDGSVRFMVPEDVIPEDAPRPMYTTTPRHGIIGYMCKIDFECELGGTSAVIRPNATQAMCAGTCGIVEVEVIGRRIIIDERHDIGYVGADEAAQAAWFEKVKIALEEFDRSDRLGLPNLKDE